MKRSHIRSVTCSVASVFLASLFAFALGKTILSTRASSNSQVAPTHVVSLPYYSVKGGWDSTLTLNNAMPEPLDISLVCYGLDGSFLPLPVQHLRPFQNVSLNLSDLLAQTGQVNGFREGSLELSFPHENGMALGPQLTVTNLAEHWSTDMEPLMGRQSRTLEGLWWSTGKQTDARLVLSNSLNESLTVQLNVAYQDKQLPYPVLHLAAHQTVVLDINEVLKTLNIKAASIGQGGLSLSHDGPIGALNAHGFIIDRREKFASSIHFVDPSAQHSLFLDGAGLPIGRSAESGSAFFTPKLLLRNTTSEAQTAKVLVQYTADGEFKVKTLPAVNLRPYSVRTVDLSALLNPPISQPIDDAGVRVETSGTKGSIIGELVSVSDQGGAVDVPLLSVRQHAARSGAHPFSFDENHLSILHLKNVGEKPTSAMVKILYEGGEYSPNLIKMLPGQSVSVDLQAIRNGNVPDIHGHSFPGNVVEGQVTWLQHGDQPIIGRLVRSSLVDGVAATFSCGGPCSCPPVFDHVEWVPSSINGVSGQTLGPLTVNEYDKYEACPGLSGITEGPFPADATFESDDPEIASVDTNGTQVSLDLAGGVLITARWETSTHNELNNECAEGGCETTCIPQVNEVGATLQVGVRPKVDSVTPDRGLIGTSNNVTISGRGFVSGAQVSIDGGSISGATLQSANSITAVYLIDDNASAGNHRVTVTVNGRASTDNVNFFVQIPTSLNVLSITNLPDGSGTQDGCPTGSFGIKISIRYQVKDQAGGVIQTDKMEPQEKVTGASFNGISQGDPVPSFTDIGPSRITGTSQFTDTGGEFLDAPFGFCWPSSFTSYSFNQTIRIVASNQNTYNVRTHSVTVAGASAGAGTISNGSDVTGSRP